MSASTIKHVYTSEAYPKNVRATGLGMAHLFTRIAGMLAPVFANVVYATDATLCIVLFSVMFAVVALSSALLPFDTLGLQMDSVSTESESEETDESATQKPVASI